MYARLVDAYGAVTVERMNLLHEDQLRDIGVTRQKSTYLLGLASAIASGQLDLEGLANMGPDDAIQRLETIRGVGQWTAGAYVLAAIGAPDVFPIGDRALQVGARDLLGMTSTPNPEELELIAETWRPIRAVAARLIWHGYLTERGRSEPEVDGLGR
jgi:DNA-3-methyladenine glycosylase II